MKGSKKQSNGTKVIALGITGSIAAYKGADLCSKLVQRGYEVHVIMTKSAMELVTPRTFFTLSKNPVTTDLWQIPDWKPGHIDLAERADLLLVAPATANIIAKMAYGLADDALSTFHISHVGPIIVAPAMNHRMWGHPATRANCAMLRERGVVFAGPEDGHLACGSPGTGRFASFECILDAVEKALR
ncbi:MAG: phosphopantothenoylcysteine decarboxylase [Lentisphaerae bacterium]|jgi:phosphopantothenoylcysteine synthetase/decarboxylase|nr:phosphopantothenoylcysteine decarboxylase [Lentisphaerota bacterium]